MYSSATAVRRPLSRWVRFTAAVVAAAAVVTVGDVAGVTAQPAEASSAPLGIDISRWQHPDGRSIHWGDVRNSGVDFVIIKATESTDYTNPSYARDTADARRVGLMVGAYDFARPSRPVGASAIAEARHFIDVTGDTHDVGVLPPALDLEQNGGLSDRELIAWTRTWLDTVMALTGRTPIIYTYKNFWSSSMASTSQFGAYPLWLAYYNPSLGGLVGDWPDWTMWQYSAGGRVPGIAGKVDMNHFNGSMADLAALANGAAASAFGPSTPFPPVELAPVAGDTTASLSWMPSYNGGSPITSYTASISPGDQVQTVSARHNSVTFHGLTDGVTYHMSVTATNALGTSDPSTVRVTPNVQTTLDVVTSAGAVMYGDPVAIKARLVRNDTRQPLAGRTVYLEGRTAISGGFRPIARLRTNADGWVWARRVPHATATYRLRYAGGSEGASTAVSKVLVRPRVSAHLNRSVARVGAVVVVSGYVTPRRSGYVYREVRWNGRWTIVERTPIGVHGKYGFRVRTGTRGDKLFRVVTVNGATFAWSPSAVVRLHVVR
jgi:GH25 family lysozyme M1 (1,4-beta-N-acetylmuramidase)